MFEIQECRSYLILRIVAKQLLQGELSDIREEDGASPKDKVLHGKNTTQGLEQAS